MIFDMNIGLEILRIKASFLHDRQDDVCCQPPNMALICFQCPERTMLSCV